MTLSSLKMNRIYHPWWNWECYKAGFYSIEPPEGMDADTCRVRYCEFLSSDEKFSAGMERVFKEWPNSCEHFLTNPSINKIAWLGQASMCITSGISSNFKGGFNLLSTEDQGKANALAAVHLERWNSGGYKRENP